MENLFDLQRLQEQFVLNFVNGEIELTPKDYLLTTSTMIAGKMRNVYINYIYKYMTGNFEAQICSGDMVIDYKKCILGEYDVPIIDNEILTTIALKLMSEKDMFDVNKFDIPIKMVLKIYDMIKEN